MPFEATEALLSFKKASRSIVPAQRIFMSPFLQRFTFRQYLRVAEKQLSIGFVVLKERRRASGTSS